MLKCKECRFFVKNPFNSDGKCEKEQIERASEYECCSSFKMKLTERELYILDFSRKMKIDRKEYKEYTGLKKQVFDELLEKGCITGEGVESPLYCFIQKEKFENTYHNILG